MSRVSNNEIKYPYYSKEENRIKSYINCPSELLRSFGDVFADAGLFYTGKKDQTICYYCGGGLQNWELTDDVWEEHAKWFSKCPYVLVHKGQEFVEFVKRREDRNPMDKKRFSTKDFAVETTIVDDIMECIICADNKRNVIFLPCKHCFSCESCAMRMNTCGYCRKPVALKMKIFFV